MASGGAAGGTEALSAQASHSSTSPFGTACREVGARRRRRCRAPGFFCFSSFSAVGFVFSLGLQVLLPFSFCAFVSEVFASSGSCSRAAALRQSPSAALRRRAARWPRAEPAAAWTASAAPRVNSRRSLDPSGKAEDDMAI